ncbi:hypothetical protein AB0442_36080 [Kitasatospora sp. NPDC085895]|uniref:hypothetical protein n=1 Tax=Kitasatospora sp. NPDC085895 TaxID=3155057 RepID=UPI00344C6BE8
MSKPMPMPTPQITRQAGGALVLLGLLDHGGQGGAVRRVVVQVDDQQDLAAHADDLQVVSLQVAAAFAEL